MHGARDWSTNTVLGAATKFLRNPTTMLRDHDKQLAELEELYQAGKKMLKLGSNRQLRAELAKRTGIPDKMLTRARQFASQYSTGEFAALMRLRKPDGSPFNASYVPWLLKMPWRTKLGRRARSEYQRQFAEMGWSVAKVRAWILAMTGGSTKRGGRRQRSRFGQAAGRK
jgi:hypothetical protein